MTTFTAFVTALANLSVTGVNRKYEYVPASLSDMPCQWPQIPTGENPLITFEGSGGWPVMRAELVVVVEAVAQNTQPGNFAATLAMMDNLSTALRGVAAGTLAKSKPTFAIRMAIVTVAQTDYWAAIATVDVNG